MVDATTSTIKDSTSYSNDGTKVGANEPVEATGKIGEAQNFDGANDCITVTHDASLNCGTDMTVEMWIKGPNFAGGGALAKRGAAINYSMSTLADGEINFQIFDGVNNPIARADVGVWDDDVWHHIVGVRDTVADKVQIYVDNTIKDNEPDTTVGAITNANNILVGQDVGSFTRELLDEIRISDVARSASWRKVSYYSEMNSLLSYGLPEAREGVLQRSLRRQHVWMKEKHKPLHALWEYLKKD